MRTLARIHLRVFVATVLLGITTPLVAPAPPAAAVPLGGYTVSAEASSVRVGIYEPAIPIPAEPQVDASIGYARSTTSTGPTSRALASYLWPGDAVGDGLGTLAGNEAFDYPVKVSSKYPASDSTPAKNAVQLTDGNGMATSADETTTKATTTGLGLGANLTSGLGTGLCLLLKLSCAPQEFGFELPVPLAAAASMESMRSQSTVTLGESSVTATARSTVSGLSLLAGLITIDTIDMISTATSDGAKASNTGRAKVVGLKVAGKAVDLGDPITVDGNETPAPNVPIDLSMLGIKVQYLTNAGTVDGATASRGVQGLTITVDVGVLGKILGNGALSDALAPILGEIPQLGPLLIGLLRLGTKIVITVGDVRTSVSATPGYDGSAEVPGGDPPGAETEPPTDSGSSETPPVADTGVLPAGEIPPAAEPSEGTAPTETAPAAFQLPGLGRTPSLLLLGALALAGLVGWIFRAFGNFMLGTSDCILGNSVGVPNLREG